MASSRQQLRMLRLFALTCWAVLGCGVPLAVETALICGSVDAQSPGHRRSQDTARSRQLRM
eukprot:15183418-Alexandrium_andersonii.AAC.1